MKQNRSNRRFDRKAFLFSLVLLLSSNVIAKDNTDNTFCRSLSTQKGSHAILFDENGTKINTSLDLGHLDISTLASSKDFFIPSKKFRLILFPKTLRMDALCSMSNCVYQKKIKSQCPATTEYVFSVGVVPYKFGPGKFENDLYLNLSDTNQNSQSEINYAFEQKISGVLSMAWVNAKQTEAVSQSLKRLFGDSEKSVEIQLINVGDRPIQLGTWEASTYNSKNLNIQSDNCSNKNLAPNETCNLYVKKDAPLSPKNKNYSWINFGKKDGSFIEFELEKFDDGTVTGSIKNR